MLIDKLKSNFIYYRDDYPLPLFEKKYSFSAKAYPKIALVKQEVYADLYCCPVGSDSRTIVLSSLLRSGFVGLFTKCNADFIIVKLDNAAECQVWKEFSSNNMKLQKMLDLRHKLPETNLLPHSFPQGNYAVNVDDVDWGQYDIVISLNISIPERVTTRFRNTVWSYCIGEPYMETFQKSSKIPVKGYDLFLNQRFRRRETGNQFHEIDFPYYLQYYGCFNDLLNLKENIEEKAGIIIEKHSLRLMKDKEINQLEQFGPIYFQEGNTEQMLRTVLKAKYYYRLGGPRRWGNAMIEAAAGGCLFLGNKNEFVNKSLFSNFTHIRSMDEFLRKVEILEINKKKYQQELCFLKSNVTTLCFNRPMSELTTKAELVKKGR
jgi:hypothetical protein